MKLDVWRKTNSISLAELANRLGIGGANPARSLQRYETGARVMPAVLQAEVVTLTEGVVSLQDIFDKRLAWERDNSSGAQP